MAEPKKVEGMSCGHPVYKWKDVVSVTGGTKNHAIEAAKKNAAPLCPYGIDSFSVANDYPFTGSFSGEDRFDRLIETGEATSTGQQCYSVTLNIVCRDLPATKQVLMKSTTTSAVKNSSSASIPREGEGEVAPGTAPIGSGRKGKSKNPAE